jgi:hypothetical protein
MTRRVDNEIHATRLTLALNKCSTKLGLCEALGVAYEPRDAVHSAPVRTGCVPDGDEHPNLLMTYPLMRERWLNKPPPNALDVHGDADEVADALPTEKKTVVE